jgi:small subunit ribosomal protein S6
VRDYELTLIFRPDVGDEGVQRDTERVEGWIGAGGGEVANVAVAGRKRLAYQINHTRDGIYVVMQIKARPEILGEVERNLKLSQDILRYMLLRR